MGSTKFSFTYDWLMLSSNVYDQILVLLK